MEVILLTTERLAELDRVIEPILQAARIPGAGIAIVSAGTLVSAKGYGYRDIGNRRPLTPRTFYPIASTTKGINATLLGMLVDEGRIGWDTPVQQYLPNFRLHGSLPSAQVTVRDLLAMRTGLPRHDWVWLGATFDRAELARCLAFLEPSAGFRERFQYNNLTFVTAGHIAEIVTGTPWEHLVRSKLLEPLGMFNTTFGCPADDNVTLPYHENTRRQLIQTRRLSGDATAPAGGTIYSTLEDMSRWIAFNLTGGDVNGHRLVTAMTLNQIHSPCVVVGSDENVPTPNVTYALGWFVDTYNGHARLSHLGYLHGVDSSVMLFPDDDLGIVSFTNFGSPCVAPILNQYAFDVLMGLRPAQAFEARLAEYEKRIAEATARSTTARRVKNTAPSHALDDYAGTYDHPGYGRMTVHHSNGKLRLERYELVLPLEHWHYDAWMVEENDENRIFGLGSRHPFDRASPLLFQTDAAGEISSLAIQMEPTVSSIVFIKGCCAAKKAHLSSAPFTTASCPSRKVR
jgi:CubicO group peptidase (beta-lactamase class C family)